MGLAKGSWIPVLESSYDSWLGLMPDGRLGVGKFHEGRVALVDSKFVVAWPFLGRDFSEFRAQLSRNWSELGEGDIEKPELLMQEIVSSAWSSCRPHWMRMCLPWILEMADSVDFDKKFVRAILDSMSKSQVLEEGERNRAQQALAGSRFAE